MSGPLGIEGVLSRINSIESTLAQRSGVSPAAPASASTGSITSANLSDFDAFGNEYQAAVEASGGARNATGTMTASGSSMYATPIPGWTSATGASAASAAPVGAVNTVAGGSAVPGVIAAPGVRPIGGYGKMPVPVELESYGNGRIPQDRLVKINQGNHRLFAPAADSWNKVVDAARNAGFELKITDSYRSYDQQVDLVRRKGLYSEGGLGARPGTSNHGWGLAVDADVRDPALLAWVRENAPSFGWVEAAPREPWHWEFRPHQV